MSLLIALLDSLMILYVFLSGLFCAAMVVDIPVIRDDLAGRVQEAMMRPDNRVLWLLASMGFLFTVFFSLFFRRKRSLSAEDLSVRSKSGNVIRISNRAITDFINKIVHSIDGVHSATVRVLSNNAKSRVIVRIKLTLWEGTCYPDVNETLQEQIRSKVASEMGITSINSIPVALDKIIPRTHESESESESFEEAMLSE
jgi:hypothetical protein